MVLWWCVLVCGCDVVCWDSGRIWCCGYVCWCDVVSTWYVSGFGGLVVSMLPSGIQDRGFESGNTSTRGLGPTMTARGNSIDISSGMLPHTLIMYRLDELSRLDAWNKFFLLGRNGTKDIQVLHYGMWPRRMILNVSCISISNLTKNIAWQTDKDDLRPVAWSLGRSPHLSPPNAGYGSDTKRRNNWCVLSVWNVWLMWGTECGMVRR
jgi:hypothetical protein